MLDKYGGFKFTEICDAERALDKIFEHNPFNHLQKRSRKIAPQKQQQQQQQQQQQRCRKAAVTEEHLNILEELLNSPLISRSVRMCVREGIHRMRGTRSSEVRRTGVKIEEYATLLHINTINTVSEELRCAIECTAYDLEGRRLCQKRRKALVW